MRMIAASCLRAHEQQLRACGVWRRGRCGRTARRCGRAALLLALLYLLQECAYAYTNRQDMAKLARVMFLLLCHVTSIVKQIVFFLRADKINALIAGFEDPLFNQATARSQRLLRARAAGARRFVRGYASCAVFTCSLWLVFPVLRHARGEPVDFPFWIPFDYSNTAMFVPVALYSFGATSLVAVANTTMDAFIATVLSQCQTQLTILRMNFEDIITRANAVMKTKAHADFEAVLMELFLECLAHHNRITETVRSVQSIFGVAVLVQFAIGGWILCMAGYKIVSLQALGIELASMALFISCILTELFLYCYYGNEVTYESARLAGALYGSRWAAAPRRFRRALPPALLHAQRPLRPVAGRVVPLSLATFLKIIKSSYTFYAVLRQTK